MKKFAVLLCISILGIAFSAEATIITFSEAVNTGNYYPAASNNSEYLITGDGKYRAVSYWWDNNQIAPGWHDGHFHINSGVNDPHHAWDEWNILGVKLFQGIYISRIDGQLFDLISMDFLKDFSHSSGGVAVTTSSDFINATWKIYKQNSLAASFTQSFGNDFNGINGVFLDAGYPLLGNPEAPFGPGLWDNIVLEQANSVIPEPNTMFLLGSGLIGLAGFRRRLKKS